MPGFYLNLQKKGFVCKQINARFLSFWYKKKMIGDWSSSSLPSPQNYRYWAKVVLEFCKKRDRPPNIFFFYKFLIFNSTPNLYENRIFWNNSRKFFSYFPRKQHLFLHQNFFISKNKVVPPCRFILRFFCVAWENCSTTPNDFDRCSAHRRREMFQEYLEKHWIYSNPPPPQGQGRFLKMAVFSIFFFFNFFFF